MKRFKKLLAFVISCTMIFGTMSMMSFAEPNPTATDPESEMAAPVTFDGEIEISGLETGDIVKFYKVLEWNGSSRTGYQTEDDYKKGVYGGWKFVNPPFSAAALDLGFADDAAAIKEITGDPTGNPVIDPRLSSEIAGKLARLATDAAKKGEVTVGANKTAKLSITKMDIGLYMAIITPVKQDTVYNPVFVSADFNQANPTSSWEVTKESSYYVQAAAKKSDVGVDKKASQGTNSHSYDDTWTSVRPGEIVDFDVDVTVPGYGSVYAQPFFQITDKLDHMTISTPPTVKVGNDTLTKGKDYDLVSGGTEGDDNYVIKLKEEFLKKLTTATTVTISYSAKISNDAPKNFNVDKNEVWIEFSHNPTNQDDHSVRKDITNHYTFTIDANTIYGYGSEIEGSGAEIVKVAVDAQGNPIKEIRYSSSVTPGNSWRSPLAGAEFRLYKNNQITEENEYIDGNGNKLGDDGIIRSGDDGRITIAGLDAGVYYLVEEKAPSGFIRDTNPVRIEIKPEYKPVDITQYYEDDGQGNVTWYDTNPDGTRKSVTFQTDVLMSYEVLFGEGENQHAAASYTFDHEGITEKISMGKPPVELPSSIINTKGVELPATGGMGTTIFYVIGAILVLGAGILLVTRRRMDTL